MAEPFLSEIRIMSFAFAPKGWALCNGQLLPINQNQALFSLLGTTYGGDGRINFALPDLRGRTPMHVGGGHTLGESGRRGGPHDDDRRDADPHPPDRRRRARTHTVLPANSLFAEAPQRCTGRRPTSTSLNPATVTSVGGSQAHHNMQPYLALNFCIALQGIFPSQN